MDKRKLSPFATILTALLDHKGLFTRREWSEFFQAPTSAVEDWLCDKALPAPDRLNSLIEVLRNSATPPTELLSRFDTMATQPATDVSPLGAFMAPTVLAYQQQGLEFYRRLRVLSHHQQQRILDTGSWDKSSIRSFLRSR